MPDGEKLTAAVEHRRMLVMAAERGLAECVLRRFAKIQWEHDPAIRAQYRTFECWSGCYIMQELQELKLHPFTPLHGGNGHY